MKTNKNNSTGDKFTDAIISIRILEAKNKRLEQILDTKVFQKVLNSKNQIINKRNKQIKNLNLQIKHLKEDNKNLKKIVKQNG